MITNGDASAVSVATARPDRREVRALSIEFGRARGAPDHCARVARALGVEARRVRVENDVRRRLDAAVDRHRRIHRGVARMAEVAARERKYDEDR